MSQSPILLEAKSALVLDDPKSLMTVQYPNQEFPGKFEGHHGHANFVFDPPEPCPKQPVAYPTVTFRNTTYRLAKIHVHSKSEHIVEADDPCDFEIHLIHVPDKSSVASPLVVIGILYSLPGKRAKKLKANVGLGRLAECSKSNKTIKINPLDFFPYLPDGKIDTKNWFHYEGSLTSFPYSEIVSWFVMKLPGNVTHEEIKALKTHTEQHARELQPLDRRLVVRSFRGSAKKTKHH